MKTLQTARWMTLGAPNQVYLGPTETGPANGFRQGLRALARTITQRGWITMDKIKPWQIVVMVVAVVAVATSAYFSFSGQKTNLATSVRMFDVNTGESFTMGFGKGGATFPGMNPNTKTISLMPIQKREDGKWYILERYMPALAGIDGSKQAVVDKKSGEVRATE